MKSCALSLVKQQKHQYNTLTSLAVVTRVAERRRRERDVVDGRWHQDIAYAPGVLA